MRVFNFVFIAVTAFGLFGCNFGGERDYDELPVIEDTFPAQDGSCLLLNSSGDSYGICFQYREDEELNSVDLAFQTMCIKNGGDVAKNTCDDPRRSTRDDDYKVLCVEEHTELFDLKEEVDGETQSEKTFLIDFFYAERHIMTDCDGDAFEIVD